MDTSSSTTGAKLRAVAPASDRVAQQLREQVRAALAGRRKELRIGRYTLGPRIGAGGMGTVFRGHDPMLDRTVAIKLIPLPDPALRGALLREAQAMATIEHPNVIEVYDVGATDDELFIVMRLVEGVNLRRWLSGEPDYEARMGVLAAAGRGLEAAHQQGVVHHDFKPENVLVDGSGHAVVIDFGLAAMAMAMTDAAGASGDASRDEVGGTPRYAAPERHAGEQGDARSDQYAWCATAVELLYGRVPWPNRATLKPEGLPAVGRVPKPVREALVRGLRRDPSERFAGFGALLRAVAPRRSKAKWGFAIALVALLASAPSLATSRRDQPSLLPLARSHVPALRLHAQLRHADAVSSRDPEASVALLDAVYVAAQAEHRARIATKAATALVYVHNRLLNEPARARHWGRLAEAAWSEGGDDLDAGALFYNLADIEVEVGQLEQARTLLERAYAYDLGEHDPEHRDVVATSLSLANLDLLQGELDLAAERIAQVIAATASDDREMRIAAETLAANLALQRHRYGAALQGLMTVVELQRPTGGLHLGYALSNASRGFSAAGRSDEARALAEESAATLEATAGPMSAALVPALNLLADFCRADGDLETARELAWRSVVILEGEHGPDALRLAGPLHTLGSIALAQGRRKEASSALRRALDIRRMHRARPAAIVSTLLGLARAMEPEDPSRARGVVLEAITLLEANGENAAEARALLAKLSAADESGTLGRAHGP